MKCQKDGGDSSHQRRENSRGPSENLICEAQTIPVRDTEHYINSLYEKAFNISCSFPKCLLCLITACVKRICADLKIAVTRNASWCRTSPYAVLTCCREQRAKSYAVKMQYVQHTRCLFLGRKSMSPAQHESLVESGTAELTQD